MLRLRGKTISEPSLARILAAAKAMPSAFTRRNPWPVLPMTPDLHVAQSRHKEGRACVETGRFGDALPLLEQACAYYEQTGNKPDLLKSIGWYYDALLGLVRDRERAGEDASDVRACLRPTREIMLTLRPHAKTPVSDPEALCVYQGEVGLSAARKIGTFNVHNCVCLIVRNPRTNKTALAHIDTKCDVLSLVPVMDKLMADGKPGRGLLARPPLQARLIGAHDAQPVTKPGQMNSSTINLSRVIAFLKRYNVDILSLDIASRAQPSEIVVDPRSFAVAEAAPGANMSNGQLAAAIQIMSGMGKKIHLAFDLTESDTVHLPLLSPKMTEDLHKNWRGKDDLAIDAWLREHRRDYSQRMRIVCTENLLVLREAYERESGALLRAFDVTTWRYRAQAHKFHRKSFESARQFIAGLSSIYLGPGADKANEPFVKFIRTNLFLPDPQGGLCRFNLAGLRNFTLTGDHARLPGASEISSPLKSLQ